MNGDMLGSLFVGFVLKMFFTKPVENLWKCLETLVVDGDVAGYRHSELVVNYNLQASSQKQIIDYASVFKQGTGIESLYEQIFDTDRTA